MMNNRDVDFGKMAVFEIEDMIGKSIKQLKQLTKLSFNKLIQVDIFYTSKRIITSNVTR